MTKLQMLAMCAGVALPIAAVACSSEQHPAAAPQAGTPAYWESNAPAPDPPSAPMIDDRSDTTREQAMPPGGDVFRERNHTTGRTDKFLWQDTPLPEPTDGAQTPPTTLDRTLDKVDAGAPADASTPRP